MKQISQITYEFGQLYVFDFTSIKYASKSGISVDLPGYNQVIYSKSWFWVLFACFVDICIHALYMCWESVTME